MVHTGTIRQTASIVAMEADHLRSGDKARVTMRFLRHPEYLRVGSRLIFREGRTKAVGTVLAVTHGPGIGDVKEKAKSASRAPWRASECASAD